VNCGNTSATPCPTWRCTTSPAVMHFVPSMLGPFLAELSRNPGALRRVSTLRRVFCSGEALPAELVLRFNQIFAAQPVQLVNLYGPTEATVDVSYFDCPTGRTELDVVPIGRPIENITLLILDDAGRRVPSGVQGELNIAGVGVARGYLDRPELTAAAFIDDPSVPGGRRYRTGDIARWLTDGNIEYLGRRDDQVKIRGNRVTLGEVENQVLACPGVRAAAVIDQPSDSHGTYLVGYFVTDAPGSADDETVATDTRCGRTELDTCGLKTILLTHDRGTERLAHGGRTVLRCGLRPGGGLSSGRTRGLRPAVRRR
jgi:acyl-coenzyme A synthetase/AMP-(fatty) acid ligase